MKTISILVAPRYILRSDNIPSFAQGRQGASISGFLSCPCKGASATTEACTNAATRVVWSVK